MDFKIESAYKPTGDQPQAIEELCNGLKNGADYQTLLGVTGSGKTFTMANVIERVNRPTLILSHNKTLAAQLYAEFKSFFPKNAVHYFVSYYDYYQPEAYIPSSDKYIEKDLMINDEIDRLRLAATTALLSGRRDVVIVSSVSCLYGIGNPEDFDKNVVEIKVGQKIARNVFLRNLVDSLYSRTEMELGRGQFRVKGDTVDLYLAYEEIIIRIIFWAMKSNPYHRSIRKRWKRNYSLKDIRFSRQTSLFPQKNAQHQPYTKSSWIWVNKSTCSATKAVRSRPNGFTNV